MKIRPVFFLSHRAAAVGVGALLVSFLAIESLGAANKTWDGGGSPDGRWQTGANWDLDTAPVANDLLFFSGGVNLATTNDFAAGHVVNGISFSVTASSFTLRGSAIVLTNSGGNNTLQDIGGSITNNSANGQTSRLNVTLARGKHSIVNTAAGQLLLGGAWTRGTGAVAHFISSAGGAITLTNLANVNGILGGWANFNRSNWASVDGGGNIIAYSAYTDVPAGGIIASNPASNVRLGVGTNVTLGGPVLTDINTLLYSSSTNTISGTNNNMNVDVGAGKILRLGSMGGISRGTNTISASVTIGLSNAPGVLTAGGTANAAGEIVLDSGAAGNTANSIIINSQITDNGTGKVRLIKTGQAAANITCSTSNSFSGGIYVAQGRLQIQTTNGTGTGPVHVLSGGQTLLGAGVAYPNEFFISGIGTTEGGGNGAIRSGAGSVFSGTITLESNTRISGGTSNNQALLVGRVTGPFSLDLGSQGNVGGGGTGLRLLNPANDWTGNTAMICRTNGSPGSTRIVLGADEVIPDGPGKGNVSIGIPNQNSQNTVALDMNGFNETINGFSIGGSSGQVFVWNSAVGTTSVLTVGNNNQSVTIPVGTLFRDTPPFSGVGGKLGIGKTGSGTLTLNGVNTYSGPTLIKGGNLVLAPGASIAASTNINIGAGAVFEPASLTFTLASGQTLSGNGMLRGEVIVSAGSTVSPGNSIGSLLVSNNVYLQSQTLMEIDATANTCDMLSSSNNLFYGGTLKVVIINGAPGPGASYKLFNAPSISGLFTTNLPPLDPGLAWRTNNLVSQGIIEVVQVGVLSPRFTTMSRAGTNVVMRGIHGTNGATYYVLTSTNVTSPRSNWTRVATNVFDVNGAFIFTNGINPTRPRQFYMIQRPVP